MFSKSRGCAAARCRLFASAGHGHKGRRGTKLLGGAFGRHAPRFGVSQPAVVRQAIDPPERKNAGVNQRHSQGNRIGFENRQLDVDRLENIEVNFSLRPNAGRACGVVIARFNFLILAVRVHLQPNSGFRILRDQVDDSLM